jgi:hypothetical protein
MDNINFYLLRIFDFENLKIDDEFKDLQTKIFERKKLYFKYNLLLYKFKIFS